MLTAENIHKSYGSLEVLRGVSLHVDAGEVVAIVGPSGAGKSTLLHILGTLDRPDAGTVRYEGEDVLRLTDNAMAHFRNRRIGFVFQFHQLLPEFTMAENVAMPAMIAGDTKSSAMAKARKIIDTLGLGTRADHFPKQLSGGECQRAAVARALINSPAVVLADEPTGSLDSVNRRELQELFFDLRRSMGQTFVIVTHDENLAADADRIIHMKDGVISETPVV